MQEPDSEVNDSATVEPGTPASPFDAAPQDPAALKGCSRPVLIGCGATVLIGALCFLLLIVKAKDLFIWAFETNAQQILANLPPDISDEEEERLRRAFDGASNAVIEGRIDMNGLQDLQSALALAGKGSVSREEILEATLALERIAQAPSPFEEPVDEPQETLPSPVDARGPGEASPAVA